MNNKLDQITDIANDILSTAIGLRILAANLRAIGFSQIADNIMDHSKNTLFDAERIQKAVSEMKHDQD